MAHLLVARFHSLSTSPNNAFVYLGGTVMQKRPDAQPVLTGITERAVCGSAKSDRDGEHRCTLLAGHSGTHRSGILGKEWR